MSLCSNEKFLITRDDEGGYLSAKLISNTFHPLLLFIFFNQKEIRMHMRLNSPSVCHVELLMNPNRSAVYLHQNVTGPNGLTSRICSRLKFEEFLEILNKESYDWVIKNIDLFDYNGCLSIFS